MGKRFPLKTKSMITRVARQGHKPQKLNMGNVERPKANMFTHTLSSPNLHLKKRVEGKSRSL